MAILEVDTANQVTDSRLGLPNPDSICRTCGSNDRKVCEGIIFLKKESGFGNLVTSFYSSFMISFFLSV